MSETKQPVDLSALTGDYEIVGELSTRSGSRAYMATRIQDTGKRRDDDKRVLITVISSPAGDEGNALTHLAADTQQLARLSHRRLIPVIEGRWLGKDAYAVVTQRTTEPSLSERIATGETFTTPRIAAILREINGLIEWARENQIVHRNITTDGVFLEPKTDRVRISFSAEAIERLTKHDPGEDARTIAKLAMAMLTGNEDAQVDDAKALGGSDEGYPDQLAEATAALIDEKSTSTTDDVAAYLALIGMADPLAAGESERERIRTEILEEQRIEREKLSAERANFEALMMSERATFEHLIAAERNEFAHTMEVDRNSFAKEMADDRAAFAKAMADDRAAYARTMAEERAKLDAERAELQRAVATERADLLAKRAELEKAVAAQRAEIERVAALDRQQIEKLREQIKAAGELEVERKRDTALDEITDTESTLDEGELDAPLFIAPLINPLQEITFAEEVPFVREEEEEEPVVEEAVTGADGVATTPVLPVAAPARKRNWVIPAAVAAGVAIFIAAAVSFRRTPPPVAAPVARTATAPAPVAVVPTSAPVVTTPTPAPTPAVDSVELLRVADSVKAAVARRIRRAEVRDSVRRDSVRRARRDSIARIDTTTPPP